MIQTHNLCKNWGRLTAVDHLSFNAADGMITGLLGANGAGKTTTLRMITGAIRPSSGEIRVEGRMGALLDHCGLYPRLTARENVEYFARLQGATRVDEAIELLDLRTFADRPASTLSLGERMRTALARAIAHDPQNLILDEPTNGLDVPSVRALRAFLRKMRDAGRSVIFSSHVLEEVRALCDHVVIMSRGALVAQGSPQDICRQSGCESLEDAFIQLTGTQEEETCSIPV